MFTSRFGIEVEFTGITREQAASIVSRHFGTTVKRQLTKFLVTDTVGRVWTITKDTSIIALQKSGKQIIPADGNYQVELVSPILTYREDINTLQELIRKLRKAGGFAGKNTRCGIHVHLDGSLHTPRSIRNFINIVASKNDLFYKALQIDPDRMQYCKKMDDRLVTKINEKKPRTLEQISKIWYSNYRNGLQNHRYHISRYHFLNLHSFFSNNHTVELRGFNSELHAGKIRAYLVFALALNHQARTQKSASVCKPQIENEKFAMRVYLNRIGLMGDEFKNCREHLYRHLNGNSAWRYRV